MIDTIELFVCCVYFIADLKSSWDI